MDFKYKDININYQIFGEGKPLLLLHGWMACIEAMAPIYQFFSKNRKVIVLDFPGQGGKSDTLTEVWGVPEYSEMIYEFMKKLQIEGADVIGHSFGGRVIIYLASKYANLFDKIILTDAAGIKPKRNLKNRLKVFSFKLSKCLLKMFTSKEKFEEKVNKLRKKYSSSDYSKLDSNIMRETFKNVINLDLTDKLSKITRPTLLVWGENDKDTPLYMAKIMEKKIKDSGIVVLKNAGHFSYLDNSTQYLRVAEVFLGGK